MKYLIVYFNNTTKNVYNELSYADSMESLIYNFTHSFNRNQGDNIVNIIKME